MTYKCDLCKGILDQFRPQLGFMFSREMGGSFKELVCGGETHICWNCCKSLERALVKLPTLIGKISKEQDWEVDK